MFPDVAEGSGDHDFHVGERCENMRSARRLPGFSDGRMVHEWYHNRAGVEMQLRSWTRDPYLPEEKSEKFWCSVADFFPAPNAARRNGSSSGPRGKFAGSKPRL